MLRVRVMPQKWYDLGGRRANSALLKASPYGQLTAILSDAQRTSELTLPNTTASRIR